MSGREGAAPSKSAGPEAARVRVRVRVLGEFKTRFGGAMLSLEVPKGSTAQDALCLLERDHPIGGSPAPQIVAFLNGRSLDVLASEESTVKPGDELLLTNPIGGG